MPCDPRHAIAHAIAAVHAIIAAATMAAKDLLLPPLLLLSPLQANGGKPEETWDPRGPTGHRVPKVA